MENKDKAILRQEQIAQGIPDGRAMYFCDKIGCTSVNIKVKSEDHQLAMVSQTNRRGQSCQMSMKMSPRQIKMNIGNR